MIEFFVIWGIFQLCLGVVFVVISAQSTHDDEKWVLTRWINRQPTVETRAVAYIVTWVVYPVFFAGYLVYAVLWLFPFLGRGIRDMVRPPDKVPKAKVVSK